MIQFTLDHSKGMTKAFNSIMKNLLDLLRSLWKATEMKFESACVMDGGADRNVPREHLTATSELLRVGLTLHTTLW
jgi:hypothetical protein